MTRWDAFLLVLAILAGMVHGFLWLCWDTCVDRDRTLD